MKKKLAAFALSIISFGVFSQSTIWASYSSGFPTNWGIRYLSAVDSNTVWGIGFHGSPNTATNAFTKTGNGAHFTTGTFLSDTNTFSASSICALDSNTAFISVYDKAGDGTSGQIVKTTDGGNTWNNIASDSMFLGANNFPDFVYFWNANTGIAVGDPNGHTADTTTTQQFEIWNTTNGGTSWTRVPDSLSETPLTNAYGISSCYAVYGNEIWFGTSNGRVYSLSDTGKWNAYPTGLYGGANGLAFRDSLHGIVWGFVDAATQNITVLNTINGGKTWTFLAPNSAIGTADFCVVPERSAYMSVGLNGANSAYATSVTHDDGTSWDVLESTLSTIEKNTTVQMLDSIHGWAGSYVTNSTTGMNKYMGSSVAAGIKQTIERNNQLTVYPNPSNGYFTLGLTNGTANAEVSICDMLGNEVYKTSIKGNTANQNIGINLSDMQKGMYLLKMQSGSTSQIQKLIIQ